MKKRPTRKKIITALTDLVSSSKRDPVFEVDVHSQTNYRVGYSDLMRIFRGGSAKDDLFGFLMDKSLTSRIVDVQTAKIMGLLYLRIIMFSRDEKPMKRTNIDGRTMRMLEKARYAS